MGLTVATLVGETRALDAPVSAVDAQQTSPQQAPPTHREPLRPLASPAKVGEPLPAKVQPAAVPSAPPPSRWHGRFGAVTGPGWDRGGWRLGGWVMLGFRLPRTPVVLHSLGSYALSSGPTIQRSVSSSRWATLGLGAGVTGTWAALDVAGTASLEVAYRRVDVDYRGQDASAQEVPVSLRGLLSFPARGALAATGGLVVRVPPVDSNESSGLRLSGPAFSAEVIAGLEVRL